MFEYRKLNEKGLEKANTITQVFEQTLDLLKEQANVPEGREWSFVKTKLEEA